MDINRHSHPRRIWLLLCTMAAALILAGCGGGSSGGTPPPDPDTGGQTVSGTAAAGAPLVGFVGAKDNADATATAELQADGSFELDLSGLSRPTLIYASGIAGGSAYQLLSVAFEDDVNGTVNITPLTDLIVGNAVGQTPQQFFNNPDFSLITQESVEREEANLKTRLKPLLDGLGVEEGFNLRNSAFLANRSGFDAVLDVLEVTIDSGTSKATIRNRVDATSEITNTFQQPETDPLTVNENLEQDVTTLQALNTLAGEVATALENQDGAALESLVTADFLNNGEDIAGLQSRLFGSDAGIEDAGELATELRNWSLAELSGGTAKLNIGAAQGPWEATLGANDEWKLNGNQLEFLVFVEPTHLIENGAETPQVLDVGIMIYAGFPAPSLGEPSDSTVTVSGDLTSFNGELLLDEASGLFSDFQVLGATDIANGDQVTFAWDNPVANATAEATYTIRRGTPDLSNGAPEITAQSADLAADEYTFEWTLPPGYDSISVRNNFTGQTQGGEGGGFTGNPLDNDARSFTGSVQADYVPSAGDELRLIARDPFGVFVSARLENPFADQVPPPMAEDALIGSWIARNADRGDNAPWVQLSFLESGHYMHQELDLPYRPEADDAGNTGIEVGRYELDTQTGELTIPEIVRDDNGFWGFTDIENGEQRISVQVDGDTLTLFNPDVGLTESTEFTRVPLNEAGITGSWVFQNSGDPSDFVVATLLEDGFYFVGSATPADLEFETELGLEFGTYAYNSETLVLNASPIFDQNGTAGLSDPRPQSFYYSTVVDGSLIFDEGVVAQLSELAPGVVPSNGDVTVDYVSPDDETTSAPSVTGDFHYFRNVITIEGQREFAPPSVGQGTYSYSDANIADNAGTGVISWSEACFADLLVDANTDPAISDAVFDSANECLPSSADTIDDVTYTESGLSKDFPAESIFDNGDEIRLGAASLDLIAVDANRSLFIGQTVRDFEYEEPNSFTDGIEISAHVLAKKSTGRTVADLEGTWGSVGRSILDIDGPNDLSYEATSQILNVDNAGTVTRVSRLDRRIVQDLSANASSLSSIEIEPEDTVPEEIGSFTITDDGIVDLGDGALGGILSADGNVLFANVMNPITPQTPQIKDAQWLAMVRMSDTFSALDLEGKEYEVLAQSFWIQPGFFEVDYLEPGASLSFPSAGGQASLTRAVTFPYVPFANNQPLQRDEGDPLSTVGLDYSVSADGRITLTTDFGETETSFELNGFATPDARLLVMESTLTTTSGSGTDEGGIGLIYAVCTNCD